MGPAHINHSESLPYAGSAHPAQRQAGPAAQNPRYQQRDSYAARSQHSQPLASEIPEISVPSREIPPVAAGGFVPSAADYARGDASKYNHRNSRGSAHAGRANAGRGGSGGGRGGSGGGRGGRGGSNRGGSGSRTPKQVIWLVVLIVSLALLLVAGGVLAIMTYGYHAGTKTYDMVAHDAVLNQETDDLSAMAIDWDDLAEKNSDIVAWVYMPGTEINYPIVQGIDDHEYLRQNFMREDSLLVHKGTIFLSEQNRANFTDEANYFFGHNMNDTTMFGPIMDMFDQNVFDERRTVYVLTPTMNYRCETFALRLVPSTELSIIQPHLQTSSVMQEYISQQVDSADIVPSDDFDVSSVSKIFSFITCGDDYASTRAVLFAGAVESAAPLQNGTVIAGVDEDGAVDSKVNNS